MNELAYILSPSFSGSTLLTFLLNAHPEIATIGELKAQAMGNLDEYDCSCGTRVQQCGFWRALAAEFERRGLRFDLADLGTHFRYRSRPALDKVLRARVRGPVLENVRRATRAMLPGGARFHNDTLTRNELLIDLVTHLQGGSVFLDGSKDPVRLWYLHRAARWNLRTIYLVRDGRGTARSYMNHDGLSMADAAREWRRTHEECLRLVARLPVGRVLHLKYEDLCRAPEETLDRTLTFLGLDSRARLDDFRAVEHHILGNAMRLKSSGEIQLDEKWRTALTPADLATFDRVAGDLNRQYGYE